MFFFEPIHKRAQARAAGLTFVPLVHTSLAGTTWLELEGQLWEAESWLEGKADFMANPSAERLRAACVVLARLHESWKSERTASASCPGVRRRLQRSSEWQSLLASGWRPAANVGQPLQSLVQRATLLLADLVPRVPLWLESWAGRTYVLQPCLCDVWHDHILFNGDAVSGIVDYGGMKIDQVSVDIARMLGSMVGENGEQWQIGLSAYRRVRSLSAEEEALAVALDRTGVIIGVVNWLMWICRDGRRFDDWNGVTRRLCALVNRLEKER